jgi:hypothetical protein
MEIVIDRARQARIFAGPRISPRTGDDKVVASASEPSTLELYRAAPAFRQRLERSARKARSEDMWAAAGRLGAICAALLARALA